MSSFPNTRWRPRVGRPIRWTRWGAVAALGLAFLAIPPLTNVPARVVRGCGRWIALGAGLELLSSVGFLLVFALIFGTRMSKRQRLGAGLRALGASTLLPAGGLVGPALGARTSSAQPPPVGLVRSTIAFTILTTAPSVVVLGTLGLSLSLGWPAGPHQALLTLPAAGVAWALLAVGWVVARSTRSDTAPAAPTSPSRRLSWHRLTLPLRVFRDGTNEAGRLVGTRNWKLAGALGYYAFDNAVLWAAFRAYGHAPPFSVIVMAYLVGSLGSLLPLPAGIGAVEGGLIGALVLYGVPAAPAAGAVLVYRGISLSLPLALSATAWIMAPAIRPRAPRRWRKRQPVQSPA
jgi:uncharacterized membrane protein YbhN (UPF0104 family)